MIKRVLVVGALAAGALLLSAGPAGAAPASNGHPESVLTRDQLPVMAHTNVRVTGTPSAGTSGAGTESASDDNYLSGNNITIPSTS